eukprot:g19942.t1
MEAGEGFERTYSCFRELPHPGARMKLFRDFEKRNSKNDVDFERKWPDTLKRLYCPGFAEVGGDQTGSALASETRECFLASAEPPIVATRREEHEEQEQDHVEMLESKDLQTAKRALSQMVLGALFVFHGTTVGKKEIIAATWESVRWGLQKIKPDVLGIKVLHLGSVDNEGVHRKAVKVERRWNEKLWGRKWKEEAAVILKKEREESGSRIGPMAERWPSLLGRLFDVYRTYA